MERTGAKRLRLADPAVARIQREVCVLDGVPAHIRANPPTNTATPAATSAARLLPAGSLVLVQRLVDKPEHNGKHARILSFDERTGRYAVALDDGKKLSLKAECAAPDEALMLDSAKKLPLRDLTQRLFVDHIGPWLDAVDIARLAMTCKWNCVTAWTSQPNQDTLAELLYKRLCVRLEFNQTGSRSRPVPWVYIFAQRLCVECWQPAVSTGSACVDSMLDSTGARRQKAGNGRAKWLCDDCRKTACRLKASELKSKVLPQTAQRFGEYARDKILHFIR
jgi:hypothetical protein